MLENHGGFGGLGKGEGRYRRLRAGILGLLTVVLAACGGGDSTVAEDTDVPVWEGEVDVLYGLEEGPPERTFGRIGGILALRDGTVVIPDVQAAHLKVFDSDGTWRRNVGREGEGPMEFRGPCCPGRSADGRLWIRDTRNGRYQALRPAEGADEEGAPGAFELVATVPMVHGAAGLFTRTTSVGDSTVIDVGMRPGPGGTERIRFHLGPRGQILDEDVIAEPPQEATGTYAVQRQIEQGSAIFYTHQPFGPRFLVDHGPAGGFASAISSEYRVEWTQPDGFVTEIVRPVAEGPPLSDAEEDRAQEAMERDAEQLDIQLANLPYRIPASKPPLDALLLSADGRLWVLLTPEDGASHRWADVWEPDGTRVARVRWPAHVQTGPLGWAEGIHLYGIRTGPLGVEQGARIRLQGIENGGG